MKNKTQQQQQPEELIPTILTAENSWKWVAQHSYGPNKPRVWLIGETGSGKTTRVREFAHELGFHFECLLVHSMLPEDILGIPKVVRSAEGFETIWAKPEWLTRIEQNRPAVLFIDEIDKPRDEVRGVLLTLLQDYKVGKNTLPHDTIIILASQPFEASSVRSNPTLSALVERSWIYWVVPTDEDIKQWAPLAAGVVPIMRGLEYTPPLFDSLSLRRASWLSFLTEQLLREGGNKADVLLLASGFLTDKLAQKYADSINMEFAVPWEEKFLRNPEILRDIPVELIPQFLPALLSDKISARYYIYALNVMIRSPKEVFDKWSDSFQAFHSQYQVGETIEMWTEQKPEEVQEMLRHTLKFIYEQEIQKFGGLREPTKEVREEFWKLIVEQKDVPLVAEAPVVRKATLN